MKANYQQISANALRILFSVLMSYTPGMDKGFSSSQTDIPLQHPAEKNTYLIPGAKIYGHDLTESEQAELKSEGLTVLTDSKDNCLTIDKGNTLIRADADIVVNTFKSKIHIGKGAIVFIIKSDQGTVLYDLCQNRPGQVNVCLSHHKIIMAPARMLVITDANSGSFDTLPVDCQSVPYREPQKIMLKDEETQAYTAEFSITYTFSTIKPIRNLVKSEDKQDKIVYGRLLKSAAILGSMHDKADPIQVAETGKHL